MAELSSTNKKDLPGGSRHLNNKKATGEGMAGRSKGRGEVKGLLAIRRRMRDGAAGVTMAGCWKAYSKDIGLLTLYSYGPV
jgi:hypothetical protein